MYIFYILCNYLKRFKQFGFCTHNVREINPILFQVFTVTLYYANSVFNPVIYFCVNPRVKEQIGMKGSLKRFRHSIVSRSGVRGDLQSGGSKSRVETSETRSRKGRETSGSEAEGNCRVEQVTLETTAQEVCITLKYGVEDMVDYVIGQEQSERGTKSLHSTPRKLRNGHFNEIEGGPGGNVQWMGTKDKGSADIMDFREKVWEEGRIRSQSEPYGMTTRITDV